MEYFTATLGYGFEAYPEMFEDWTGLTAKMIAEDFEDVLTEYAEHHEGVRWVDYGSNRKNPEDVAYFIMASQSIRYCDGLLPARVDLPVKSYERSLRETVHKLNVKDPLGWYIGIYEW